MQLSLRWAERCRTAFGEQPGKAMFGIVQGGDLPDLRVESARALTGLNLKGYAIGGLAVGEPQAVMLAMIETVEPHLPTGKPRYLMGVGTPDDLMQSVMRGIDMFDCVMPTRAGRHGLAIRGTAASTCATPATPRMCARSTKRPTARGARLFPRLSPSPRPFGRDPGDDVADVEQPRLLPGPDGRHAGGDRRRSARGLHRRDKGGLGPCRSRREGLTLSAGRRASAPWCSS